LTAGWAGDSTARLTGLGRLFRSRGDRSGWKHCDGKTILSALAARGADHWNSCRRFGTSHCDDAGNPSQVRVRRFRAQVRKFPAPVTLGGATKPRRSAFFVGLGALVLSEGERIRSQCVVLRIFCGGAASTAAESVLISGRLLQTGCEKKKADKMVILSADFWREENPS